MEINTVKYGLGALATLDELEGFIEPNQLKIFREINTYISFLYVRGYLTEKEKDKANKRLAKDINKDFKIKE